MSELCKNYKPEILQCPICKGKLVYKHAVSNKVVHFSSGKTFRIRNLGYGCSQCNDKNIYVSQTANKLSLKGSTYSTKVNLMIYYFKQKGLGREVICDILLSKGIEISDRNVDVIYRKINSLFKLDPDVTFKKAYDDMLEKYNYINLSIDVITICQTVYLIVYDYFSCDILVIKEFNTTKDPNIKEFLSKYINPSLNINLIASIRKDANFIPMLKSICPENTKFISYQKF